MSIYLYWWVSRRSLLIGRRLFSQPAVPGKLSETWPNAIIVQGLRENEKRKSINSFRNIINSSHCPANRCDTGATAVFKDAGDSS